jgi:transglutaminase-like putative cysteine protease
LNLILETEDINEYLKSSDVIDYTHESIENIGESLSIGVRDEIELVKKVYEYVRDNIAHSFDINGDIVTCNASDVLEHKHGICYAKSHLLCAILRFLGIPTGFCYQKLILDTEKRPWLVLHGLNAVYLKGIDKWVRIDARGNKEGVNAQFSYMEECLAFNVNADLGEVDLPVIYANPSKKVIKALQESRTVNNLINHLPSEVL